MTSPSNDRHSPSSGKPKTEVRPQEKANKTPAVPEEPTRQSFTDGRDFVLTHEEAEAGSPQDGAACGEEDPGAGLELLVSRKENR